MSRITIPIEMQIWNAADIAAYIGLSKRYVAENLVYKPGFPRPMKKICKHRQWKAGDIIRWRDNPPRIV